MRTGTLALCLLALLAPAASALSLDPSGGPDAGGALDPALVPVAPAVREAREAEAAGTSLQDPAAAPLEDPAATALGTAQDVAGGAGATAGQAAEGLPPVTVDVPGSGLPDIALGPVSVGGGRAVAPEAPLQGGAGTRSRALPDAPSAPEAAAAGGAAAFLVFQALGLDGLRAAFTRPASGLGRALRWLRYGALGLPLFSRIEPHALLENDVRARVHETVLQEPGVSLEEVRARNGIAWGTAVHHLRRLEGNGLVVSVRQGNRRLFFPANTPQSRNRGQLAVLSDPRTRQVADLVRMRPGIAQHELCDQLGMRNPAASKQLGKLAEAGLVAVERDGRRRLYRPTPALEESVLLLAPAPVAVHAAAVRSEPLLATA